jgi:hypothetical protein
MKYDWRLFLCELEYALSNFLSQLHSFSKLSFFGGFWSIMIRMLSQLNENKYDSYNNFITSSTCVNSFPSTPSQSTKSQFKSSNSKSYPLRWTLKNLCQFRWKMNIGLRKVFLKREQLQTKWSKRAQNFTIWLNRQSSLWNK